MPVLFLLGVFIIWCGAKIYDFCTKPSRPFTDDELNSMRRQMIGKSQKERRDIFNKYKK